MLKKRELRAFGGIGHDFFGGGGGGGRVTVSRGVDWSFILHFKAQWVKYLLNFKLQTSSSSNNEKIFQLICTIFGKNIAKINK